MNQWQFLDFAEYAAQKDCPEVLEILQDSQKIKLLMEVQS